MEPLDNLNQDKSKKFLLVSVLCLYLDLHALLQQSLCLVLHLQPGSANQQQVILNHLNAAQVHALGQIIWSTDTHRHKETTCSYIF